MPRRLLLIVVELAVPVRRQQLSRIQPVSLADVAGLEEDVFDIVLIVLQDDRYQAGLAVQIGQR